MPALTVHAPTAPPPAVDRSDSRGDAATAAACGACPHPLATHDTVGLRFCRATASSALDRGCICRPA